MPPLAAETNVANQAFYSLGQVSLFFENTQNVFALGGSTLPRLKYCITARAQPTKDNALTVRARLATRNDDVIGLAYSKDETISCRRESMPQPILDPPMLEGPASFPYAAIQTDITRGRFDVALVHDHDL